MPYSTSKCTDCFKLKQLMVMKPITNTQSVSYDVLLASLSRAQCR